MMEGMRKAGQSWLGRAIITIMFSFLILSFAIWGIGDIFRGRSSGNIVAKLGSQEITIDQVRSTYQNELQQITRQQRRPITPQQARAMGLDTAVFGRLLSEAALTEFAKTNGLGISDAAVVQSVVTNPAFQDSTGQFSRAGFEAALRNANLNERTFLQEQKGVVTRQQVAEALAGDVQPPLAMLEAIHRYGAERRAISYFVRPASGVTGIPAPDDAALRAFYDARKASFRTPEFRKATILAVDTAGTAKTVQVSDADARASYDANKARYVTPERRAVQQIVLPNAADAVEATEKLKAGSTFEQVAEGRGLSDLGNVARADIFDKAVADAAFALKQGEVSAPVAGQFGTVLVRVSAIQPEHVQSFEEAAPSIRQAIAAERARGAVADLHDKIEDQRLSAKPLSEIATSLGLSQRMIETDRGGFDRQHQPVADIPERQGVLNAVFASDIGVDNEALRLGDNGYLWFEINNIDVSRERPFDEVKGEVESLWRDDEVAKRLAQESRALVARLDKGETIETLAAETVAGQEAAKVETATDIGRDASTSELGPAVVAQIYAVQLGKAGDASHGADRVIFKVTDAQVPPFARTTQSAITLEERLKTGLTDDLLASYIVSLQNKYGLTVNQQALRSAFGDSDS